MSNLKSEIPFSQAALLMDPRDSVAIAKCEIAQESMIIIEQNEWSCHRLRIRQNIPPGHKFAIKDISEGEPILKYGNSIGTAIKPILIGDWVHTHNLHIGNQNRDIQVQVVENKSLPAPDSKHQTFMGFPRSNGKYGTRNYIAIVSTASCSAQTALAVAEAYSKEQLTPYANVDGVIAITHPYGCCIPLGELQYKYLQRTLINLIGHPNIGGIIFIALGCEVNQMSNLVAVESGKQANGLPGSRVIGPYHIIQAEGGFEKTVNNGIQSIENMLSHVNETQRMPAPVSELTLALQCGGSDAWSGITANPLVGRVVDKIIAGGGTAVISETPEIFGAEHLLTCRSISKKVGKKLIERVQWWQRQAELLGFSLDNNPTPGNKAGGLTTIFEKSLGAVAKAGSTPLMDVLEYAETITSKGLIFMDTPGYDPVSVTGQVAGGCNLVLFTTGRGSIFGGQLAPCVKISSNNDTYYRMIGDMDFNGGTVLDKVSLDDIAHCLYEEVINVASGTSTKSEHHKNREAEFIPWQPGAVL